MIVCTECGREHEDDAVFCQSCSAFLEWSGKKVEPEQHAAAGNGTADQAETAVGVAVADAPTATIVPPKQPAPEWVPPPPRVEDEVHEAEYHDVVCRVCGAGNRQDLHFCRHCGATLFAVDLLRPPLWRRILRRPRTPYAAGTRRGWAARKQRLRGTKRQLAAKVMRVLAVLLVIAAIIGGLVWAWQAGVHHAARAAYEDVRKALFPHFAPIRPVDVTASSQGRLHTARAAFDKDWNTYWLSAGPGNGVGERLTVTFRPAVDLTRVGIFGGNPIENQIAPKDVQLTYFRWSNEKPAGYRLIGFHQISLENKPGFQRHKAEVKDVGRIVITIRAVYPSQTPHAEVAITEVEFFKTT